MALAGLAGLFWPVSNRPFVNVLHCFVSLFTELERRISIPAYLYCVRIKAKRIDLSELASTNLRFAVLQSDIKHSVIEPCRLEGK
jgi:hypothetical protein